MISWAVFMQSMMQFSRLSRFASADFTLVISFLMIMTAVRVDDADQIQRKDCAM